MTPFRNSMRFFLVAVTAFAVSACSNSFRSQVTSFHELPAALEGKTIAIVPIDDKKRESLEFKNYAALVGAKLTALGFKAAGDDKPDYVVGFDYSVNDGREKIRERPTTQIGLGYWSRFYGWGAWGRYDPFYPARMHDQLSVSTVYKIEAKLEIREPKGKKIYEARADTESRKNNVPETMPLLVDSIFKDFPGDNGKTRRVVIELNK